MTDYIEEVMAAARTAKELSVSTSAAKDVIDMQQMLSNMQLNEADFWTNSFIMPLGNFGKDLTTSIFQYMIASDMMDQRKEEQAIERTAMNNAYALQTELMEKEYEFKDAALKNQKYIAQIGANVEIQKTRISGEVKKTIHKDDMLARLFSRQNYGYGYPAYA